MVTINDVARLFCQRKNIEPLDSSQKNELGRVVADEFNKVWAMQNCDFGAIPDAGFMKIKEEGKTIVVKGYPNVFADRMLQVITWWYDKSKKPVRNFNTHTERKMPESKRGEVRRFSPKELSRRPKQP